jgi:hypothetical protein
LYIRIINREGERERERERDILNRPVQFYLKVRFNTLMAGFVTKKYGFMSRVTILCIPRKNSTFIYIYNKLLGKRREDERKIIIFLITIY